MKELFGNDKRSRSGAGGAVMVEFLVAYLPVLIAFLAFWQLGELLVAQMIVERAASAAGRAAVVVLPDDPAFYSGETVELFSGERQREIRLAAGMMLAASPHLSENFTVAIDGDPGTSDSVGELTVTLNAEFRCNRLKFVCGTDGVATLSSNSQHTYHSAQYQYAPFDPGAAVANSVYVDSSEPGCSDGQTDDGSGGTGTRGIGGGKGRGGAGGHGGTGGGHGGTGGGHGGTGGHSGSGGRGGSGGGESCPPGQTMSAIGCKPGTGCGKGTGAASSSGSQTAGSSGPPGSGPTCPYTPPGKCPASQKLDPVTATCKHVGDSGTDSDDGQGGHGGSGSGGSSSGGSGGACSQNECNAIASEANAAECQSDEDNLLSAFGGLDFEPEVANDRQRVKQAQQKATTCSCPGASTADPSSSTACTPPRGKNCPVHTLSSQLDEILAKCKTDYAGEPNETYYRVQGGKYPQASQSRVSTSTNPDSSISVKPGALCVSKNGISHAQYFAQMRANQAADANRNGKPGEDTPVQLFQWEMPGWFNKCVEQLEIPQKRCKQNPRNLNGLAPKIVDPNQPGDSYEFNDPWYQKFAQYSVPGSLDICTYSENDAGTGSN
jgi:hypothetical protein